MDGFIDRTMKFVDATLQKSALGPDAETRFKMFLAGRPRDQYATDDPKELQKQINGVVDILVAAIEKREEFKVAHLAVAGQIQSFTLKYWVLVGLVIGEGAVIGWLATQLLARIH